MSLDVWTSLHAVASQIAIQEAHMTAAAASPKLSAAEMNARIQTDAINIQNLSAAFQALCGAYNAVARLANGQ